MQVIYAAVSEEFVHKINRSNQVAVLQFGDTLFYDTHVGNQQRLKGRKQRGLASKVSHAKKQGTLVYEFDNTETEFASSLDKSSTTNVTTTTTTNTATATNTTTEGNRSNHNLKQQMETVAEKWLSNRSGVQAYITPIDLFSDPIGKRW